MDYITEELEIIKGYCVKILEDIIKNFLDYKISYYKLEKVAKALFVLTEYPNSNINGVMEIVSIPTNKSEKYESAELLLGYDFFELAIYHHDFIEDGISKGYVELIYNSSYSNNEFAQLNIERWLKSFHPNNIEIYDESEYINEKELISIEPNWIVDKNGKKNISKDSAITIARNEVGYLELREFEISDKKPRNRVFGGLPDNCWYITYSANSTLERDVFLIASTKCVAINKISGEIEFEGSLKDEG